MTTRFNDAAHSIGATAIRPPHAAIAQPKAAAPHPATRVRERLHIGVSATKPPHPAVTQWKSISLSSASSSSPAIAQAREAKRDFDPQRALKGFSKAIDLFTLAAAGSATPAIQAAYTQLTTNHTKIEFTTYEGARTHYGLTRLFLRIDGQSIDIDEGLASSTFDSLNAETKIIVQIGLNYSAKTRGDLWRAAIIIAHEFTVHAMPFLSVVAMIHAGAKRSQIVKHWTASKNNGLNAADNQHHRLGQGQTEFMNLIADMSSRLRTTRDRRLLQDGAAKHVIEYAKRYPPKHKYHTRE